MSAPRALEGLRVLDAAGPLGNYCGKLFADLGADVILVEPPAGTRARCEPPFIGGVPGLERSLSHAYYNANKRGVTLDLDSADGRGLFARLAATSDIVLDTEAPGAMAGRGLGYAQLAAIKPSIVCTSITPFGQSGPYAHHAAEDLTALAMGGLLYLAGYEDAPPVRMHGNQAVLCANMFAAVATMLAMLESEATGEGQHIDVSMQECVTMALETSVQFFDLEGEVRKRHAGVQRFAGTGVFDCADGQIYLMAGGIGANKFWGRTIDWFAEEGMAGVERFREPNWERVEFLRSAEAKQIFADIFVPWVRTRRKEDLYREGQRRKIPIATISKPSDLLCSAQLAHRGYFVDMLGLPDDVADKRMPGAPYKLSRTPWSLNRAAPRLGEHNAEVFGALGLDAAELERLYARRAI